MRIRQLLLAVAYRRIHGAADIQNPYPLIKSQIQSGPEPDIDFFFDNRRCMFCRGSGTKQTQPGSALALPAAFADINIHTSRSVYYLLRSSDFRADCHTAYREDDG
jgi:hypothetical protein